jgi:hypothetical protein
VGRNRGVVTPSCASTDSLQGRSLTQE